MFEQIVPDFVTSPVVRRAIAVRLIAALVLCPAFVHAAPPGDAPEASASANGVHAAAESGFERLDDDYFTTFSAKLGIDLPVPQLRCRDVSGSDSCDTRFRAALQAPLRLRVIDRGPSESSIWRQRDWDEPGDYLKFLRHLEYGEPAGPVHAEVGELGSVELGHGTIVNHYHTSSPPITTGSDSPPVGMSGRRAGPCSSTTFCAPRSSPAGATCGRSRSPTRRAGGPG